MDDELDNHADEGEWKHEFDFTRDDEFGYWEGIDNPYDAYEGMVYETGYDPYGSYMDDAEPAGLFWFKFRLKRFLRSLKHRLRYRLSAKYRASWDTLPF